jgi:hypothetical protein
MEQFLTVAECARLLRVAGYRDVFVERQTFGIAHLVGGRKTGALAAEGSTGLA